MIDNFSDYIIYADESGDHNLEKVDEQYPIFCLALCVIKKSEYINNIVPAIQQLKFDYWGHDKIVLHEREIRKQEGEFAFLRSNEVIRRSFLNDLSKIIIDSSFGVVSSVIKKENLNNEYPNVGCPYQIALIYCMEKLLPILLMEGQEGKQIHCIFENRGKKEDALLEGVFSSIVKNLKLPDSNNGIINPKNLDFSKIDFQMKFASKSHNSTGLQLADLIARPIGLSVLRPKQKNSSYEIIKEKYYNGYENKIFP